jgi:hypothetical protein
MKKLAKAQFGKFVNSAVKVAKKVKSPTEARSVNSLLKGKESMVNAHNPNKILKKPRTLSKAEQRQKEIDDSYRKKGAACEKAKMKKMAKGGFPDLNKDGKVTKADILKGRGVIKKMGGSIKKK